MSPDTFDDFVTWRDSHDCERVTVGDACRYFTGTPLTVIVEWWALDKAALQKGEQ